MAAANGLRQALSPRTRRVFFALRPDARVRVGLAQAARRMQRAVQGRRTSDDSLHLTLAFLGEVSVEALACLMAPPRTVVTSSAFLLSLDEWGCWAWNRIGWTAPSIVPEPLHGLAANLQCWLRGAGFELDNRHFAPHVTLVRQAQCIRLADSMVPVEWQVVDFELVHSHARPDGAHYETLGAWRLE
jgi:2'-5' RNA ligase